MRDFYEAFYTTAIASRVHAEFCERVFGLNLGQHGFADMAQIERVMQITRLSPGQRVLDLGCGSGMIAEYISDCTGAHVMGLDYIPAAIHQAQTRTANKANRLAFRVGDINALNLPRSAFDVIISIDSIYFSEDYPRTICDLMLALRPGGQMAFLYAYGREPWVPKEEFPADSVLADRTPLANALKANGLNFQTWDLTQDDYRLAQQRKTVLSDLRPRFEAEGLMFIYDNRMGDAQGISQAIEEGLHARYLYHVQTATY